VQQAVAAAQAKKAAAQPAAKGGFRETAWFKKGEIEEELAKQQAAAGDSEKSGTTGEHAVVAGQVDQSKIDVSAQDKARLSLKTGATQQMSAIRMGADDVPGDKMSEDEMLAELSTGKKKFLIAGLVLVLVAVAVALVFVFGGKKEGPPKSEVPTPAPEAVAAAPPPPTPSPPPAAVPAPPPPPDPTPAPSPPPEDSPEKLIAEAEAAAKKDNVALAVDLLTKANGAGADAKSVGKLQASLGKSVALKLVKAKRKKDKAGMAEANALATRLKSLKAAKKR
jgi:hypothetical protein